MNLKKIASLAIAGTFALGAAPAVRADEGMWTLDNVPRAAIKEKYGFEVTDAWLKKVQLGAVRFNSGGSGSFVSPDGLVLTNHHVAAETIAKLSTPERDLIKQGFLARSHEEELKAPDLELNQLVSIEDVTDRVNGAAKVGMSAGDANTARLAMVSEIEKESLEKTGLRSDVVTLYQGGKYALYRYKKYTDVRLVFAPEFDVAFFGGDPDNFTYPRYCLDMALVRVYEDGKPARTDHYLKFDKGGSKEGDLSFVIGNPGSTARLYTLAHLEFLRDDEIPFTLDYIKRTMSVLEAYGQKGEEQERQARDDLFGYANSYKVYANRLTGLRDATIMARKRAAEEALLKKVMADKKMKEEYADAWETVAKSRAALKSYNARRRLVEGGVAFNSTLFDYARTLVRLAEESKKPNSERLREYTDAGRESLELSLYSTAPVYPDLEEAKLASSLAHMEEQLGATGATVKAVLDGKSPAARAKELVAGTKLADPEARRALAAGGVEAIEKSDDPMIRVARAVDAEARELRKRYETEVTAVERPAYSEIARAVFATEGTGVYPDATFTLRLSYGAVKGYMENGAQVAPYTTMAGMFAKSAAAGNKQPYHLPQRWLDAKGDVDMKTPFNFVSTNDIIGGNSGSPVLDKDGDIVGLVFDGNIQSIVGHFVYDDTQNRTVSVDVRGILEVLEEVYDAKDLVAELTR
jgi:hypothetical protein